MTLGSSGQFSRSDVRFIHIAGMNCVELQFHEYMIDDVGWFGCVSRFHVSPGIREVWEKAWKAMAHATAPEISVGSGSWTFFRLIHILGGFQDFYLRSLPN